MFQYYRAVKEAQKTTFQTLDQLKESLDKHKVYGAIMQKYGAIGAPLVEYFDKVSNILDTIDPADIDGFINIQKQLVDNLDDAMLLNVLKLDDDSLISYIAHQSNGILIIPVGEYMAGGRGISQELQLYLQDFMKRHHAHDDLLISKKVGDNLILTLKNYDDIMKQGTIPQLRMTPLDYTTVMRNTFAVPESVPMFKRLMTLEDMQIFNAEMRKMSKTKRRTAYFTQKYATQIEDISKSLFSVFSQMELITTDLAEKWTSSVGSFGRGMLLDQFTELFKKLPQDMQDAYLKISNGANMTIEEIWKAYGSSFNFSVLGRANMRRAYEPMATNSLENILSTAYNNMTMYTSSISQYAAYFGEASPMNVNNLFQISDDFTDAGIFSTIRQGTKNGDFVLVDFAINDKGIPFVHTFNLETMEDLFKARERNMAIMPAQVFSSFSEVVNNYKWNNPIYNVIHKVTYGMKLSMLILNPGYIFRNILDSTLKNIAMFKDPVGVAQYYIKAIDYYRRYNETIDMLFALSRSTGKAFDPFLINELFDEALRDMSGVMAAKAGKDALPMTMDEFWLIHNFVTNGPSAGPLNRVSKEQLTSALAEQGRKFDITQRFYEAVMMPTKQLEQIFRLSEYMQFIDKGLTNTEVFNIVTKTHFDYAAKGTADRLLELIIPFYSFQAKNFAFWTKQAVENPLLISNIMNMMAPVWNMDQIDFSQIKYNESNLNRLLQGNIQLNQSGLSLKIAPSFLDPLQLLYNPTSITGRAVPVIQSVEQAAQASTYSLASNLGTTLGGIFQATGLPGLRESGAILGAGSQLYSRYKSGIRAMQRTGSPLPVVAPSIFGANYTASRYNQTSYYNQRTYMDAAKRNPRRVRIYDKLYTSTGKNRWALRFRPLDNFTLKWRIRESVGRF